MTDLAIDVHGLTKRYSGRAVVDNVSLQVARGSICGFLGPNGSGKTTTITCCAACSSPMRGRAHAWA